MKDYRFGKNSLKNHSYTELHKLFPPFCSPQTRPICIEPFTKRFPTNQYHPDTERGTAECFNAVFTWPNISNICIECTEASIQSYDQTASLIYTSKCRTRRSDTKLQSNSTYEKAL